MTLLVWLCATAMSFAAALALTAGVGEMTHSGPLGSCGPYGRAANLLIYMLLGSVPFSIGVGTYAARRSYRYLTRDEQKT